MKILYLAKHHSGDNDDEGAIAYALEKLGHTILPFQQGDILNAAYYNADFCLIHKCENIHGLNIVSSRMPLVSWYFDMIHSNDEALGPRTLARVAWMNDIMPLCTVCFCTDGDWVNKYPDKCVHLLQGADERYAGLGFPLNEPIAPILFTGTPLHGLKRETHVRHLQQTWGDSFQVMGQVRRARRHGRDLANVFSTAKIIIAPDGPNTDNYWSNRVYLTTGFGGFLLHPFCKKLREQYRQDELLMYQDWDHLDGMISDSLNDTNYRTEFAYLGHQRTMKNHLYRNRCEELISIVKERIQ